MPRPYTYRLENQSGDWYIGVRMKNVKLGLSAEQDTAYMSSSKYVKARIKAGEVFTKHIIAEYETVKEAGDAEQMLLKELWNKPGRINKALGFKFEMDGEVRAMLSAKIRAANNRDGVKAKRNNSVSIANKKPEVRARKSASALKAQNKPETKAKMSTASKAMHARPEVKAKICKPCTVDGVTIYPSKKALVAQLGSGKKGFKHQLASQSAYPSNQDDSRLSSA